MSNCEMCGSEGETVLALIEGVELNVCSKCAAFGKQIKRPVVKNGKTRPAKQKKPEKEIIEQVKYDFAKIIRDKREKMGLKQEEFAKFLSEKESIIQKIETGDYTPSLSLARKIEKQLGIVLVEQVEVESKELKSDSEQLTIGDMINIKD